MTVEEEFGLWLHLDTAKYQAAIPVKMAIGAAFGHQPLGRGWFEAMAQDDAEIEELEYRTNAEREWNAIRTKHGFRG